MVISASTTYLISFCVKEVETFHHNHNTLKCNEEENDISLNDVIVMKRQQK